MSKPLTPRDSPSLLHRALAPLLAAAVVALAVLPAAPAWAASNQAHVDREVLKAMEVGQSIKVILVARGDLNTLEADLRRTGLKHPLRVPIAHGFAVELTPALINHFRADSTVARLIYDAPVNLSDTPFNATALATVYPAVVDVLPVWSNMAGPCQSELQRERQRRQRRLRPRHRGCRHHRGRWDGERWKVCRHRAEGQPDQPPRQRRHRSRTDIGDHERHSLGRRQ
jgi:hypothetical protein